MSTYEEMFESTTDAVFGTDKHMRIRFWNKACEELFKIEKDKALGRSCHELVCGKDLHGNTFCNENCSIAKYHDKETPNRDWDLLLRDACQENIVVNIGSYYPSGKKECSDTDIYVFHSMRVINSHQLIRRLSLNPNNSTTDSNLNSLSKREYEIFKLIASGVKVKTAAAKLGISVTTVRNHIKSIYSKLNVHSQAEAINYAVQNGII